MRTTPTVREVVEKLTAQGSADQIAAFFEAHGVIGTPRASYDCPVALYVHAETGDLTGATPMVIKAIGDPPEEHVHLDGIGPVADFMVRFDDNHYPALDVYQRGV